MNDTDRHGSHKARMREYGEYMGEYNIKLWSPQATMVITLEGNRHSARK